MERRWAWGRWTDADVDTIVSECLEREKKALRVPSGSMDVERRLKRGLQVWVRAFLSDTGSMFRLYRKSGFDVDNAIPALRDTLQFRVQHRRELLWSPIPHNHSLTSSGYPTSTVEVSPSRFSRRSSASSRTSAQSPRSSPAPEGDTAPYAAESTSLAENGIRAGAAGSTDTLLQLYPPSSVDPNRRPIVVVSLRYLDNVSSSLKELDDPALSAPPKTHALAGFERLRCYLAEEIIFMMDEASSSLEPLQFILILDLAGGRVSGTAWDMVKWLVRDGADHFHGMCSAVFVVNYSWEFGALWSFIKHVLPAPAKARVIFPTVEELVAYLGEDVLPPSLGGSCISTLPYYPAPFEAMDLRVKLPNTSNNPRPVPPPPSTTTHYPPSPVSSSSTSDSRPTQARRISLKHFHATSRDNPYYGYPATVEEGVDAHGRPVRIQHSRRRKRDLLRTLCWLLLLRCRERGAYLLSRLRDLGWRLVYTRRGRLAFLVALLTLLVSVHRTDRWRDLQARWSRIEIL